MFSALQEGLTQVWELCGAHIKTEIFYDEGNKWTLNKDSNYTEDAIDLFFKINCLTAKKVFAPSLSFKKHRLFGRMRHSFDNRDGLQRGRGNAAEVRTD